LIIPEITVAPVVPEPDAITPLVEDPETVPETVPLVAAVPETVPDTVPETVPLVAAVPETVPETVPLVAAVPETVPEAVPLVAAVPETVPLVAAVPETVPETVPDTVPEVEAPDTVPEVEEGVVVRLQVPCQATLYKVEEEHPLALTFLQRRGLFIIGSVVQALLLKVTKAKAVFSLLIVKVAHRGGIKLQGSGSSTQVCPSAITSVQEGVPLQVEVVSLQ